MLTKWEYIGHALRVSAGFLSATFQGGAGMDPTHIRPEHIRDVLTYLAGYGVTEVRGTFRDTWRSATEVCNAA